MNNFLLQQEIEQENSLPVLPPGIANLFKTLANENITYDVVAKELERFPAIAIRVVATANSSWAAPAIPITSLRDSCARLGSQLVLSMAIALSVSQSFNPSRCPAFESRKFWVSALLTAEAAYFRAKEKTDICPDTARLAGLLHNIGLLWLAENKPAEVTEAVSISQNENVSFAKTLLEKFDIDVYDVGGYLAASLELPEAIGTTIASSSLYAKKNHSPESINTNPLITNHHYAQQIAEDVLLLAEAASTDTDENDLNEDGQNEGSQNKCTLPDSNPHITQLTEKLSSIQSMAQVLFFS